MRTVGITMLAAATIAAVAFPGVSPADRRSSSTAGFVGVRATEHAFSLSRPAVRTGRVTFELQNFGEDGHDLKIRKTTGHKTVTIKEIRPGDRARRTLRVTRGRYRLWCSLPGHRQAGMAATLTVRRAHTR